VDEFGLKAKDRIPMRLFLRPMMVVFASLTLITGVAYPLLVTGLAQLAFPAQANGSFISRNGQAVGSRLIGQPFDDPGYFWGRPSATLPRPYAAFDPKTMTGSAGSNLGPLNPALLDAVQARILALRIADPGNTSPIPVDLVTASASGLDPHISVAAAFYQVARVARARAVTEDSIRALVEQNIEGRQLGLLGEPRVNVLLLNLALDESLRGVP
jgi:K+-transporting ATPase ATPase C chain